MRGMLLACGLLAACGPRESLAPAALAADPLPSWNDDVSKQRIVDFVTRTTTPGSAEFIPVEARIAVFDNDGTLWAEQPLYFQFFFLLDRVRALAPAHPEWKRKEPFRSALAGDVKGVLGTGVKGFGTLMAATSTGTTREAFDSVVHHWVATARHPVTKKPYTSMVYQPQLELLRYLRSAGYKTYIVSGGGLDFMRPWTDSIYGIPPEQVVGSRAKYKYELVGGRPSIVSLPEIDLIDDKSGKPVGIAQAIGRRPVIAVGNSDGDYEMLDYTTSSGGARLGVYIHHDDAEREWAYDRDSHIGQLAMGLDSAQAKGWLVVSMRKDWKQIYP